MILLKLISLLLNLVKHKRKVIVRSERKRVVKKAISEFPCASISKRVLLQNHSVKDKLRVALKKLPFKTG